MSDSSGCVWSEIIPLFLSEGLRSAPSKGTKEEKGKKQQQKKKLPGRDDFLFFLIVFDFIFRSAYELNHISNGA